MKGGTLNMSNLRPETRKVEQTQERSHTVSHDNLQSSGTTYGCLGPPTTTPCSLSAEKIFQPILKLKNSKPGISDTPWDTRDKTKGR